MNKLCKKCNVVYEEKYCCCPYCCEKLIPYNGRVKNWAQISLSDWLQYLGQFASPDLLFGSYLLNYANYVIAVVAVIISIITYTIIFTPGLIIFIGILSFIIIIMALILFYIVHFLPSRLMAKIANKLSEVILSNQYPNLRTIDEIHTKWQNLRNTFRCMNFSTRRRLIKMNNDDFDKWFNLQ